MSNDTLVKLSSRLPKATSLDGHADAFHSDLGGHYIAIVEFRVADRTEVDPDSDAHPRAKLEITAIEVAYDSEDDAHIRSLQREIYDRRTSEGTLDYKDPETGEISRAPSDSTVPTRRGRG